MNLPSQSVPFEPHFKMASALWGLTGEPRFIRRVANFVYEVNRGSQKFILRLTELECRTQTQLESELHWVLFLAQHGASVAMPVLSTQEKLVELLEHHTPHGPLNFYAAVFEFAQGEPVTSYCKFTPLMLQNWGTTLAEFHLLTQKYGDFLNIDNSQIPALFTGRPQWHAESMLAGVLADLKQGRFELAQGADLQDLKTLRNELNKALCWMHTLPQTPDTFGLIHSDFHMGNFFVENNKLQVFDFDDCCHHWFLYDFAVSGMSLGFSAERDGLSLSWQDMLVHLAEGYRTTRAFSNQDEHTLLLFIRYRMVLLNLWGQQQQLRGVLNAQGLAWCVQFSQWRQKQLSALPPFQSQ